jgi:hypothetical protein
MARSAAIKASQSMPCLIRFRTFKAELAKAGILFMPISDPNW